MDETYIRIKGRWTYLYRAVDSRGETIDFLLSARRDAAGAKRFFRKALAQPRTVNPRTITVDKNPSYPCAVEAMKDDGIGSFRTARRTLSGYEVMAMMRKGQIRKIGGRDMQAQTFFVADLFQIAA